MENERIECPECNLVDWAHADTCKRCDHRFNWNAEEQYSQEPGYGEVAGYQADSVEGAENAQPNEVFSEHGGSDEEYVPEFQPSEFKAPPRRPSPDYSDSTSKPSIKMAVISMIMGILGMPIFSMFWGTLLAVALAIVLGATGAFIGGGIAVLILPLGLILGIVALVRSNKRPSEYGGKGFAIAGIVCSSIGVVILPIIAAIAIPNLFAARRSANEGAAISTIRTLVEKENAYMAKNRGRCVSLDDLGRQNAIDSVLATGRKMGYHYIIVNLPSVNGGCEITATPLSESVGARSFFYSTEEGVFRAAAKKGEIANQSDPELGGENPGPRTQISLKDIGRQ